MKKILMSTAAIAGLAFVAAAPARADEPALQLGLGGYVSGYAVYTDQDEPAGTEYREFDFRKDTEVHLNGEVALDNGVTAGAHMELLADRGDATTVQESYMYLSSAWGRVNFGEEDGIAYLLQVGAPSADDKIDGIRPDIAVFGFSGLSTTGGVTTPFNLNGTLDYAQDDTGYSNKLTYITPVFNGFQAGVSYTPTVGDTNALTGAAVTNTTGVGTVISPAIAYEDAWEIAARYEGSFNAIDLALGAGYSHLSQVEDTLGTDDLDSWNVGVNLGFGAFGVGGAYVNTNNGLDPVTGGDGDTDTWVAGVDYTTGPYKLGVSYLNQQTDAAAFAGTDDQEADRWTAGVIYEWGPGMTFRGAVQYQDVENIGGVTGADTDGTAVTLGTQLEF